MDTEQDLLAAIIAAPDDDGPRAVYADWLLQRGDRRGELITIQLELARLDAQAPTRPRLEARDRTLQQALRDVLPPGTRYDRGFPTLLPATFALAELPDLLVRAPYRVLTVTLRTSRDVETLVAATLTSVQELWIFSKPGLDAESLGRLADWPGLARIARLYLDGRFDAGGLGRVLARCPLRYLGYVGEGSADAITTAVAAHAPAVEELNLSGVTISADALAALATLPLHGLRLSENHVTPALLATIRPLLERLVSLDLARNPIGDEVADVVARGRLQRLHVWQPTAPLGDRGLVALAGTPVLRTLVDLQLFRSTIGAAGVRALVDADPPALATLDLAASAVGDDGAALLARWPGARRLRTLVLAETGLTDAGMRELAASPYLHALDELNVFRNRGISAGADRLFGARRRRVRGVGHAIHDED